MKGAKMEQDSLNCEEIKIDLRKYTKVVAKRKKTFIAVFVLFLAIGLAYIRFSPKKYRISMILQPPIFAGALFGSDNLENAENLKSLIGNGAFNDKLREKLKPDLNDDDLRFEVVIPPKTNILQVSVERDTMARETGVALLEHLSDVISASYVKPVEAETVEIANQIKLKEYAIVDIKGKAKNLQDQIKETIDRQDRLKEEIKAYNINTAQIIENCESILKGNSNKKRASILAFADYLQSNSSYLNQLNNQFSDLSTRRDNLSFELRNIDSQISILQIGIDKLNISKDFISNLKIICQPRVSPNPIGPNKKKILADFLVWGLFSGMVAVFLREHRTNKLKKND